MAFEGSQAWTATHNADGHHVDVSTEARPGATLAVADRSAGRSREWVPPVIALLDAALSQLQPDEQQAAQGTLRKATSLLRALLDSDPGKAVAHPSGRLLAWQVRRVRDYIDSHIASRLLVADLVALVQRSEAHFSRAFRLTFGESPHSFVLRRRVEWAAQYMLQTNAALSDIALRCGFADQAHLCRRFRQITGQAPSVWRRARRTGDVQ